jgi:hypothetical protein
MRRRAKRSQFSLKIQCLPDAIDENGGGSELEKKRQKKNHYGSINFPLAALIAASVRVAAPSLPRALSV